MQTQPLNPETIIVAKQRLLGLQLPDSSLAAVFSYLCASLALAPNGQIHRIKQHPVLKTALVSVSVQTPGGPQQMNVLLAWGIPLWLAGIRISAVAPTLRERLVIFQREVADALYRHFFRPAGPAHLSPDEAPGLASQQITRTFERMDERPSMMIEQMVVLTESLTALEATQAAFLRQGANPSFGNNQAPNRQLFAQVFGQAGSILDTRLDGIDGALSSISGRLVDLLATLPTDTLAPSGNILPVRLVHLYVLAQRAAPEEPYSYRRDVGSAGRAFWCGGCQRPIRHRLACHPRLVQESADRVRNSSRETLPPARVLVKAPLVLARTGGLCGCLHPQGARFRHRGGVWPPASFLAS